MMLAIYLRPWITELLSSLVASDESVSDRDDDAIVEGDPPPIGGGSTAAGEGGGGIASKALRLSEEDRCRASVMKDAR